MKKPILILILCVLWMHSAVAQENWPKFRGPDGTGTVESKGLPETWSTNRNVDWATEIPGWGWSSPTTWGNKIFVTAVRNDGTRENPKKGLYFGGERPIPQDTHHWVVYGLDLATGARRWATEVHVGLPASSVHLKNTYASETPVTDGQRVYAYFGNVGIFCLDLDGKAVWSRKFDAFKTRNGWGTAASPVVHEGRVYVLNDNEEQSFLVALDAQTGNEIWRVARDEKSNWATPYLWQNPRRAELVVPGKKVRSYDFGGHVLWELGGMSSIVIPTPFAQLGLLYVSSGYVGDSVRPIFALRPGASGDISLKGIETQNEFVAWSQKAAGPYNPSPLVYGDYMYVLYDFGFLSCFDARTGREIYGKQRLNTAGTSGFTASPWAYQGKVFCLSEDGDTFVVQAGPEYKLLAKNSLDEMCMATPAIAQGGLIIRSATKLYRIVNGRERSAAQLP